MEPDAPAASVTDRDLLCRYAGGDQGAFGELYDRHARGLLYYLHSLTGDASLAEDLLQEAFVRLVAQSPFRLKDSVRGLLYTIGRNLACDEARRAAVRLRTFPLLVPTAEADGAPPEATELLSRALHTLPEEQREVLALKFHADLTFLQIGELTGVPESTVKSRYKYAIDKLSEILPEE